MQLRASLLLTLAKCGAARMIEPIPTDITTPLLWPRAKKESLEPHSSDLVLHHLCRNAKQKISWNKKIIFTPITPLTAMRVLILMLLHQSTTKVWTAPMLMDTIQLRIKVSLGFFASVQGAMHLYIRVAK